MNSKKYSSRTSTDRKVLDSEFNKIIQDSKERTERAPEKNRNDSSKALVFFSIITAAVAIGLLVFFYLSREESAPEPVDPVETQQTQSVEGVVGDGVINPVMDSWKDAPSPLSKEIIASVEGENVVTTSEGKKIQIGNVTLEEPINECKVAGNEEFCLVTSGKTDSGSSFDVYFFKDAVRSRTLENPGEFELVEVSGSPVSGRIDLAKSNGESIPSGIIVTDDATGVILMFDGSASSDDISRVLQGTNVV